jgi:tetratricopeptide (TPR) repeat protein
MTLDDYQNIANLTARNQLSSDEQKKVDSLDELIRREPKNIPARMRRGFIFFQAHMDGKAIETFNEVLKLNPHFVDAYIWLVELLLFHWADTENAVPLLKKAKEIDPHRAEIYYLWACALQKRDDMTHFIEYMKKAIALEPSWMSPRLNLIQYLVDITRDDEAQREMRELEKYMQRDFPAPDDEMALYYEHMITGRVLTDYVRDWIKRLQVQLRV